MIQRIQSVYLILCALGFGGLFLADLAVMDTPAEGIWSDARFTVMDNASLWIISGIGVILSILTVFLYTKRAMQSRLCTLIGIFSLCVLGLGWYELQQSVVETYTFSFGWVFPLFALFFSIMAGVFIRKDEETVRSMDRLR
ncbi:MAG: DUF4293 domain-containing protein [Saprospiraceae bacterium]|jgi:hypothetical protein|nr:DUF4293 domain-containing protein [Saprospiraceae bacterium]